MTLALAAAKHEEAVSFRSITDDDIVKLKQINNVIFPINYSPRFYTEILNPVHAPFCKLVFVRDVLAGTICCRVECEGDEIKLYLMTMGVLARYRDRKVGTRALDHVLNVARRSKDPIISSVYLHVQVSNESAKRFYQRNGFMEVGLAKGYYKKIQPRDAWILECKIQPRHSEKEPEEERDTIVSALNVTVAPDPAVS